MSYENFRKELTKLINRESIDARVGCPDDVLSDFLFANVLAFKAAIAHNTPERKWFPAYNDPVGPSPSAPTP